MTDANNYPNATPLTPRQARQQARLDELATRAERQRQADNSGKQDRLDELVADVNAYAQRAYWSLTVMQAQHVAGIIELSEGYEGAIAVSGDHRPPYARAHRAAIS